MRSIYAILCVSALLISCTNKGLEGVEVKSEEQKNLYALGARFGNGLRQLNLNEQEALVVARGFLEASSGKAMPLVDEEVRPELVQKFLSNRTDSSKVKASQSGKQYAEEFLKQGAKKTNSGLLYQIVNEGEGVSPGPQDTVEIHFHGYLPDGTVFASTRGNNTPMRYPLDKIIAGWAEGLKLLKEGGEIKLVIPPEIGYGDNGAPPKIPGNATLVLEIHLLKVIKNKGN